MLKENWKASISICILRSHINVASRSFLFFFFKRNSDFPKLTQNFLFSFLFAHMVQHRMYVQGNQGVQLGWKLLANPEVRS